MQFSCCCYSFASESPARWNYDRDSVNGRLAENGSYRDDGDDEEIVSMQVKGQTEISKRSDSPVLRPLPSMSFIIVVTV